MKSNDLALKIVCSSIIFNMLILPYHSYFIQDQISSKLDHALSIHERLEENNRQLSKQIVNANFSL